MIYGILWYIMVYYGILWYIMVYYGILWYIMVYDIPWSFMIILWKCLEPGRTWKPKAPKASPNVRFRRFDGKTLHLDGELLPTFVHGQLEHVNGNGWMDFNNTQNQAKDILKSLPKKCCWIAEICWNEIAPNSEGPCNIMKVRDASRSLTWASALILWGLGLSIGKFLDLHRLSPFISYLSCTASLSWLSQLSPVEQIFLGEKTSSSGPCQYVKLLPQVWSSSWPRRLHFRLKAARVCRVMYMSDPWPAALDFWQLGYWHQTLASHIALTAEISWLLTTTALGASGSVSISCRLQRPGFSLSSPRQVRDKDPEILCVLVVDTAEAWDNIAGFRIIIIIIIMIIMTMITRRPVFPISGEASLPWFVSNCLDPVVFGLGTLVSFFVSQANPVAWLSHALFDK